MGMKISVILVKKSLSYIDDHACPTSIISFLHKIHSNASLLGEVVLGGNGKDFSVIKISSTWERHENFDEILH